MRHMYMWTCFADLLVLTAVQEAQYSGDTALEASGRKGSYLRLRVKDMTDLLEEKSPAGLKL